NELVRLLASQVKANDFSESNNEKILQALNYILYNLDIEFQNNTKPMNPRTNDIRLRLKAFIPELESMFGKIKDGSLIADSNFKIGYVALLIWADPNNPTDFDLSAPFKDLNRDGTYTLQSNIAGATQCNHFVFEVIDRAINIKMTKGESVTSGTRYGMMGAGVYFGNERDKSEAAVKHLSTPFVFGDFGNVISFSNEDNVNHASNYIGGNHVGIYIGNDLYISASGLGVSPFPAASKSVLLGDVHYHAHYSEVR
ncbi:MAG: hypothetical protein HYZ54_02180, partial [Ignavibacteriae bacterium]|nr:hypothetical protein [Ignavibacteriota bacterium]